MTCKLYIISTAAFVTDGRSMQILKDIFTNHILLAALSAWLLTQFTKIIIHTMIERKFTLERVFGDGGMPSVHSATVSSLATICGLVVGFDSPLFAVSAVFAVIVMRDAMGIRREAGKHAMSIKELAEKINGMFNKDKHIRTENIKMLVGHSPIQVLFGCISGILIAIIYYFIFVF